MILGKMRAGDSMKSDASQQGRLQIIVSSKAELCQLAQRLRFEEGKGLAVRVVRGTKMRSALQLFDEFSAAFQFPLYFGENWDAFEECLNDLEWLPARGYVLLVSDTPEVLSQQQYRQFEIFADILFKTSEKWGATEPTKQFH